MTKGKRNILIYSLIGLFVAICIACVCCIKFIKIGEKSIEITYDESITLNVGDTHVINVKCTDSEANLTYDTNSNLIEVNENRVTARSAGIAYVNVRATHGKASGTKKIRFEVKGEKVDLGVSLASETDLYLIDKQVNKAGMDGFFNYVYYDTNDNVGFSLSKNGIVTVSNAYKKITAIAEGTVTITFYSKDDSDEKSIHIINVKRIEPILTLTSEKNVTLDIGETADFGYSIAPVYYTGSANVITIIEDEEIASVSDGKIRAIKSGSTTLKVYLNNNLAEEISITVREVQTPVYVLSVSEIGDCKIVEKTIYAQNSSFCIKIAVKNAEGETVSSNIQISGGEYTIMLGGLYAIESGESESLTIIDETLGINETFNIVINS